MSVYEIEILDNNNILFNRQYYTSTNKILLEIEKFCESQDSIVKYEYKEMNKVFNNKKLIIDGDIFEIEDDKILYKFNIYKLIVK